MEALLAPCLVFTRRSAHWSVARSDRLEACSHWLDTDPPNLRNTTSRVSISLNAGKFFESGLWRLASLEARAAHRLGFQRHCLWFILAK